MTLVAKEDVLEGDPTPVWSLESRAESALHTATLASLHTVICFCLLEKNFPARSYGTAFEDFSEPQLGRSFFEVPHSSICCQWQALEAPAPSTFRSHFKIYFFGQALHLSSRTHSHPSFPFFLSLRRAVQVIRVPSPRFFFSLQAVLWSPEGHGEPPALEYSYLQVVLGTPARPRADQSWSLTPRKVPTTKTKNCSQTYI